MASAAAGWSGLVIKLSTAAGRGLWAGLATLLRSALSHQPAACFAACRPANAAPHFSRHRYLSFYFCRFSNTQVPGAARAGTVSLPAAPPPACPLHGQCSAAARAGGQRRRQQQHGVAARRHRCFLSALHASMQLIQRRRPPDACDGSWAFGERHAVELPATDWYDNPGRDLGTCEPISALNRKPRTGDSIPLGCSGGSVPAGRRRPAAARAAAGEAHCAR